HRAGSPGRLYVKRRAGASTVFVRPSAAIYCRSRRIRGAVRPARPGPVATKPPEPNHIMANACIGCGVCCASYRVSFHWSETTLHELGRVPHELTEPLRHHEVAMRGTSSSPPRCIALAGTPGVDARCAIHGRHPSCCRAVAPGDDQCVRARVRHGRPPLADWQIAESANDPDPPGRPLAA